MTVAKQSVRCSSLPRLEKCPGSRNAEARIKGTTSEAAESGTMIHAALETFIGMPEVLSSQDMAEAAIESITKAAKLEDRNAFVFRWFALVVYTTTAEAGGAAQIISEKKGSLELGFDMTLTGSPDLQIITVADALHVWEYKTGMASVETSESHLQGQGYLLRAVDDLEWEGDVVLHMLAAGNDKGENHTFTFYTQEDLDAVTENINAVVEGALDPDAPRVVSLEGCQYCKAAGTMFCIESCKAIEKFEGNVIKMEDPVAVFGALEPAQRSATVERAKLVAKIAGKIIDAAKAGVKADPEYIPGWGYGKSSEVRSLPDANGVFQVLNTKLGVTPEQFQGIAGVKLTAVIKLIQGVLTDRATAAGEKTPTKKAMEEMALAMVGDLIARKPKAGSFQKVKA